MKKVPIDTLLKYNSEGLRPSEIALLMGTHPERVKKELLNLNIPYNQYVRKPIIRNYMIPEIQDLLNKGYSKAEISRKLNTYKLLIIKLCRENGIVKEIPENHKICGSCKCLLLLDLFGLDKTEKDGKRTTCKSCRKKEPSRKESSRKWAINNRELKKARQREYLKNNSDKIRAYRQTEAYKKMKAESDKNYYLKSKNNPDLLIARRIRSMVSTCVRNKNGSTFHVLGYEPKDLVEHLESKFSNGMSWDNYGRTGWHIDHVRPLASFNTNDENWYKEAFSLKNLQPLWASENCSKGSLYNGVRYTILKNKSTLKK